MDFAYDRISVPMRVYLYDNHVVGFEEKQIRIRDALKTKENKFDYEELMRG
jgi:hypothetical protein